MRRSTTLLLITALLAPARRAAANDSAASIAAGGIVLRDEKRVAMRRERLTMSLSRVTVEYEFVNESQSDVTTEVAFPVPEYAYAFDGLKGPLDLGGFRAWVDGAEIQVSKQVRALVAGEDHGPLLRNLGIDVERHGNFDPSGWEVPGRPNQIAALPADVLGRLVASGTVEAEKPERGWPRWTVAITWHWTQTFPAGRTVKVRHEYTPAAGHRGIPASALDRLPAELPGSCPDAAFVRAARRAARSEAAWFTVSWVSYILETARSWKQPIGEFELVIDRPEKALVTFCWDGPVEKVGKTRFRAVARDFAPARDLTIYFLEAR